MLIPLRPLTSEEFWDTVEWKAEIISEMVKLRSEGRSGADADYMQSKLSLTVIVTVEKQLFPVKRKKFAYWQIRGNAVCSSIIHKEPFMSEERSKAYTAAGVNIEAGNSLVSRIKSMVRSTAIPGVLSDIGSFGGLFAPDVTGMKEPALVASTDGVGTKLKLAFEFDRHDTVGIDLVAMSVNDILVQGAAPLFFLDYFACGALDVDKAEAVISGVAEGCRRGGCALLGGETAEMPGMYGEGEYDLAGFCVGLADKANLVDGSGVVPGDVILGLPSSGVHSNGYTLVRKLFAQSGASPDDIFPGTQRTFADVLMEPTIIYTKTVKPVFEKLKVKAMVHITGGGFYDNIPRVLPEDARADIRFGSWEILPVFDWLRRQGALSWPEMLQIFNCGIGYMLVMDRENADKAKAMFAEMGQAVSELGVIAQRRNADEEQVSIIF